MLKAERKHWRRDKGTGWSETVLYALMRIEKMIRALHTELVAKNPPVSPRDGAAYKRAATYALRYLIAGERLKAVRVLERVVRNPLI